jgi:hypothetical protein
VCIRRTDTLHIDLQLKTELNNARIFNLLAMFSCLDNFQSCGSFGCSNVRFMVKADVNGDANEWQFLAQSRFSSKW